MRADLDALLKEESDAYEGLSQAFIRHSIARNRVINHLREIREDQPTLFTQDKDD